MSNLKPEDFDFIYHEDGTCHRLDCGRQGVILAYDTFSPEGALWFCAEHWGEYEKETYVIAQDKRPKVRIKQVVKGDY